jgi:hypothetical protein
MHISLPASYLHLDCLNAYVIACLLLASMHISLPASLPVYLPASLRIIDCTLPAIFCLYFCRSLANLCLTISLLAYLPPNRTFSYTVRVRSCSILALYFLEFVYNIGTFSIRVNRS